MNLPLTAELRAERAHWRTRRWFFHECGIGLGWMALAHLLGFDHTRLTYRFQGRDFRLTDVHGEVVKGILA